MDWCQDSASFGLVLHDASMRREVGADGALQVERELRPGLEVGQPAVALRRRRAADVDPPVAVVKHDLDPPRVAAASAGGREVGLSAFRQGTFHPLFQFRSLETLSHTNSNLIGARVNPPLLAAVPVAGKLDAVLEADGRGG